MNKIKNCDALTDTETQTDRHTHTHTLEYYSVIKRIKNEIMSFTATWMKTEIIITY